MKRLMIVCMIVGTLLMMAQIVRADTASLTWTANVEADLQGYKVYRFMGATCPATPLAGPAIATTGKVTTYADTTIPDFDGTLCYEITAIDLTGNESGHSNRATKAVNLVPPVPPVGLGIAGVTP